MPRHINPFQSMRASRLCLLAVAACIGTAAVPAAVAADPVPASRQASAPDTSAALAALAERYYDAEARFDPLNATFNGDSRFNDQLNITISPKERSAHFAALRMTLQELAAIDRARLAPRDAITYDVLQYTLRDALAFEAYPDHLLPINHMGSVPVDVANLASGESAQPLVSVADYDAYLKRISRIPAWIDQAIINMREGMQRGVVQPKALMIQALPQLKKLAGDGAGSTVESTVEANVFYTPVRNLPTGFTDAQRARLSAAYRETIATQLLPALRRLAVFVETEYLPACRDSAGWSALPQGAAWYQTWIHSQTTTDLTPDRIHAIGLQEVARITAEISRVGKQLGYTGTAAGLTRWRTTQTQFTPFKTDAQILQAYRDIDARIKPLLPALFGRMPKAPLEIRPEPELTRATASAHYGVPAPDGSRPGIFWAVIQDPRHYETIEMTSLLIHEGQPGHHFQLALQQELDLPKFRKFGGNNAYVEGWALYSETLGREMGLYADPVAYIGQLEADLLRAVRLVTDTGLHAQGWSRERSIRYMQDTQGITEAEARQCTERYMAWPGQALGYKIGALKIRELRDRASAALGPKFRLAAFHDAILEEASLPLSLLETRMDGWIAGQK